MDSAEAATRVSKEVVPLGMAVDSAEGAVAGAALVSNEVSKEGSAVDSADEGGAVDSEEEGAEVASEGGFRSLVAKDVVEILVWAGLFRQSWS